MANMAENGLDEDVTTTEKIDKVLAVFWKRGRLGAAFFNCETYEASY